MYMSAMYIARIRMGYGLYFISVEYYISVQPRVGIQQWERLGSSWVADVVVRRELECNAAGKYPCKR